MSHNTHRANGKQYQAVAAADRQTDHLRMIWCPTTKVSLLAVDSLWGDCTFILTDWGSYYDRYSSRFVLFCSFWRLFTIKMIKSVKIFPFSFWKLISEKTMERRSTSFLRQSISMEIQRGNCASILGTVESPKLLEELFDLFDSKSDHFHS